MTIDFKYKLKGLELSRVYDIRDLGVVVDSKLTFEKHIDHIIKRANKSLGFIIRSCSQFTNLKIAKILYCSYVRSNLEYCSQVWNPRYGVYINRLESVQRKFLRYLNYKCKGPENSYHARCKKHHMLPLFERRRIVDITTLVKLAQCCIDSSHLLSLMNFRVPNRNTRQRYTLSAPTCTTNYRQNSFLVRSVNTFNSMVDTVTLDIFNSKPKVFTRSLMTDWFIVDP
jgi:hypothetical protein